MRLNLSDDPLTADLLAESLGRTGSAIISVNGTSMHPTLQFGWRVYLRPARGEELRIGDIAVFRGERYLTIHRLVWKEGTGDSMQLVFRGDYNRLRERVDASAVIGRVVAVEVPGMKKGAERVVAIETDILSLFYRGSFSLARLVRPLFPKSIVTDGRIGPIGRAARATFSATERFLSLFLPERR
jgi:signal peptidase I